MDPVAFVFPTVRPDLDAITVSLAIELVTLASVDGTIILNCLFFECQVIILNEELYNKLRLSHSQQV